jgi:hypothetical protein
MSFLVAVELSTFLAALIVLVLEVLLAQEVNKNIRMIIKGFFIIAHNVSGIAEGGEFQHYRSIELQNVQLFPSAQ